MYLAFAAYTLNKKKKQSKENVERIATHGFTYTVNYTISNVLARYESIYAFESMIFFNHIDLNA